MDLYRLLPYYSLNNGKNQVYNEHNLYNIVSSHILNLILMKYNHGKKILIKDSHR